jgi:hypothetical protein
VNEPRNGRTRRVTSIQVINGNAVTVQRHRPAFSVFVGLLRDRTEVGKPGDFEQLESISEVLEKVAQEAGPEAASALSKAFCLDSTQE